MSANRRRGDRPLWGIADASDGRAFAPHRTFPDFQPCARLHFRIFRRPIPMAQIAPSVIKQAYRIASRSSLSTRSRRISLSYARVANATSSAPPSSTRHYVTETKRDNAQISDISLERAIRLDKGDFEKAGLALSGQQESNTPVSPMAGELGAKQGSGSNTPGRSGRLTCARCPQAGEVDRGRTTSNLP